MIDCKKWQRLDPTTTTIECLASTLYCMHFDKIEIIGMTRENLL